MSASDVDHGSPQARSECRESALRVRRYSRPRADLRAPRGEWAVSDLSGRFFYLKQKVRLEPEAGQNSLLRRG